MYHYSNMAPRLLKQTSMFGVVFFVIKSLLGMDHIQYINILTWIRDFESNLQLFKISFAFHFPEETWIQTPTTFAVCPESVGTMLDY